jgi:hypothetical protein
MCHSVRTEFATPERQDRRAVQGHQNQLGLDRVLRPGVELRTGRKFAMRYSSPQMALLLLALWLQAGAQPLAAPAQPDEADWEWLDAARPAAFDILMPLKTPTGQSVAYRRYRDLHHDAPELYLRIDLDETGATSAVLLEPIDRSIQEQLLELHTRDRLASIKAAVAAVKVRRVVASADRCPSLAARLAALADLKLAPLRPDIIVIHPVVHRLVIESSTADVDMTSSDPDTPLEQWASLTAAAIRICAAGR